jgi:hypothetical protein
MEVAVASEVMEDSEVVEAIIEDDEERVPIKEGLIEETLQSHRYCIG